MLVHPLNKIALLESNRSLLVDLCHNMSQIKVRTVECFEIGKLFLLITRIEAPALLFAFQNLLGQRFEKIEGPLSSVCSDEFLTECWGDYLCVVTLLNNATSKTRAARSVGGDTALITEQDEREHVDSLNLFKEYAQWMRKYALCFFL